MIIWQLDESVLEQNRSEVHLTHTRLVLDYLTGVSTSETRYSEMRIAEHSGFSWQPFHCFLAFILLHPDLSDRHVETCSSLALQNLQVMACFMETSSVRASLSSFTSPVE